MRAFGVGLVVVVLGAYGLPVEAAPVPGVCRFTSMVNHVFAPVDLPFVVPVASVSANVVVDAEAGVFALDGASITVPPYDMQFADANEVFVFAPEVFTGTIDGAGSVTIPDVRWTNCTLGTPEGTDCVPSNLCSNDTTRICTKGAGAGIGCDPPGVCQGVCRDDQTQSCATDADCGPGGFCGTGTLVPFSMDLTTGVATFTDVTVIGAPLDFTTGSLTLADVTRTPPESPIIQDTGITSLFVTCALDTIPSADTLPPPVWTVRRGRVRLGRDGAEAADDDVTLTASLRTAAGAAELAAEDVVLALGTAEGPVLTLRVPKGAFQANRRGTRFKVVDEAGTVRTAPPLPPGATARHRITLARKGDGWTLKLASKGLVLDALAADLVVAGVEFGALSASAARAATTRGRRVSF